MIRSVALPRSMPLFLAIVFLASCDRVIPPTTDLGPSPDTLDQVRESEILVFSPAGGSFSTPQLVTIKSSLSDAEIFYTMGDSLPTIHSEKFTSPILVKASTNLKVISVSSRRKSSSVDSQMYWIVPGQPDRTIPWNSSIDYDSLRYGGVTYRTVKIGTQTWMAENLSFGGNFGGIGDVYPLDAPNPDSIRKYGYLYTWAEAMNLPDSCNIASCSNQVEILHRGICPVGWHVPSDSDWTILTRNVGEDEAGTKLRSIAGWVDSGNGTDDYGFRVLPTGEKRSTVWSGRYSLAMFHSSSEINATTFWARDFVTGRASVARVTGKKSFEWANILPYGNSSPLPLHTYESCPLRCLKN